MARGLADAQAVLSSLPSPELFPGVGPTLELLAAARRDVAACVSEALPGPAPPPARAGPSRPPTLTPDCPSVPLSPETGAGTIRLVSVSPAPAFALQRGG